MSETNRNDFRGLLRRYKWIALPKLMAFAMSVGAILLWMHGQRIGYDHGFSMRPGGAYMTCSFCALFVVVMNRVEQLAQEIKDKIDTGMAKQAIIQLGSVLEALGTDPVAHVEDVHVTDTALEPEMVIQ